MLRGGMFRTVNTVAVQQWAQYIGQDVSCTWSKHIKTNKIWNCLPYLNGNDSSLCSVQKAFYCTRKYPVNTSCRHYSKYNYNPSGKNNPVTPLFLKLFEHKNRTALIDQHGQYTYNDLGQLTDNLADRLTNTGHHLQNKTVCFLCENDSSYIVTKLAIWTLGGIAVPLCKTHPSSELEYFLQDSNCSLVMCTEGFQEKLSMLSQNNNIPLCVLQTSDYVLRETDLLTSPEPNAKNNVELHQRRNRCYQLLSNNKFKSQAALIVYTSGTTGRPKVHKSAPIWGPPYGGSGEDPSLGG